MFKIHLRYLVLFTLLISATGQSTTFVFDNQQFSFQALRTAGYTSGGGADLGECLSTCYRIVDGDLESWYTEWSYTAEVVQARADSFLALHCQESARDCYFRASGYFRTAEFFLHTDPADPRILPTWRSSVDNFLLAASMAQKPILPVEIPFEDTFLPAYLCLVDETGEIRPMIIAHSGFDGTKEELFFSLGTFAVEMGYNCLLFEGPGQGQVIREQGIPFRPDWESVVTPVFNYAVELPFVDPEKIALIGYSMGGYLAPRAVSNEHRIAACIANGGEYSMYQSAIRSYPADMDEILSDPEASMEYDETIQGMMDEDIFINWFYNNGMWTFGADSPSEFMRMMQAYTMEGLAGQITCPMLILNSENDQLIPGQADMLFDSLNCPRQYYMFTEIEGADEHCQMGAIRVSNDVIFCWLNGLLGKE